MTVGAARDAAPGESLYSPRLLLLALTVGVSYMGVGFVLPLRAIYGQRLGASSFEIGLMASAALLSGFLTAPAIGSLADRVGQRRVLWCGLLVHGLLVLAYIPARDPLVLIGLRALEGVAIVGILPPARALMNGLAPRSCQGEALGVLGSAQMVGLMLGPAFGTLLASRVGYGAAFLVAALPLFAGAVLARCFLPAHMAAEAPSRDEGDGTKRAIRRALFAPRLLLPYALSATIGLTGGVISALWAIYMLLRGASLELIGLSYTAYAIIALVLAPLAGRFSDRRGRYGPILASLVIFAVIYCLYAPPVSALWLVLLSATEGVAGGIARSALDGLLAEVTPAALRGRVQANYTAASTGGAFVMAALAGVLYRFSPGLPFLVVGMAFGVACVVLLLPAVRRLFPGRAVSRSAGGVGDALEASVEVVVARGE
jgi:MFS transporter, DHA1 family, multidrug resistance protein